MIGNAHAVLGRDDVVHRGYELLDRAGVALALLIIAGTSPSP
jgi:hypothetical protein